MQKRGTSPERIAAHRDSQRRSPFLVAAEDLADLSLHEARVPGVLLHLVVEEQPDRHPVPVLPQDRPIGA